MSVNAIKHIIATVFSAQNALRELAPDFKWAGMGNLLGDYGEYICIENYNLEKAPAGSSGYDVFWSFYDNDDILFYSTNDLQPNLTFNQQGYYSANLLVTDSIFGCFNTEYESDILVLDSLVINIDSSDFFISNCNPYVVNYSSIFELLTFKYVI